MSTDTLNAITKLLLATDTHVSDERILTFIEAVRRVEPERVERACERLSLKLTRHAMVGDVMRELEEMERESRMLAPPERRCPVCKAKCNDAGACMACSWHPDTATAINYEEMRCCAWNIDGMRCHYPGSMSRDTMGAGPWYCKHHVRSDDPHDGRRHVEDSHHRFPQPDWTPEAVKGRFLAQSR